LEDLGLVAAVEMLASDTGVILGSDVEFHCLGKVRRLEAATELALYRIVQEALNNITRHSDASRASVQMTFLADMIQIKIEDNGKGFTVPESLAEFASSGHYGLLGMLERADLIGGAIHISSSPGKGTSLIITAPFASVRTSIDLMEDHNKPG
jgi:two-component system sensor histidine kinase DegS